ncbi:MAG: hypothetical protein FJ139_01710 [Deltaproteobacteria bacterium]|nr:hypothetical protein [Deltaproteobacteria bacterium]
MSTSYHDIRWLKISDKVVFIDFSKPQRQDAADLIGNGTSTYTACFVGVGQLGNDIAMTIARDLRNQLIHAENAEGIAYEVEVITTPDQLALKLHKRAVVFLAGSTKNLAFLQARELAKHCFASLLWSICESQKSNNDATIILQPARNEIITTLPHPDISVPVLVNMIYHICYIPGIIGFDITDLQKVSREYVSSFYYLSSNMLHYKQIFKGFVCDNRFLLLNTKHIYLSLFFKHDDFSLHDVDELVKIVEHESGYETCITITVNHQPKLDADFRAGILLRLEKNQERYMTSKTDTIIEYCRKAIQRKLGLMDPPEVRLAVRMVDEPDSRGHYKMDSWGGDVAEPAEFSRVGGWFNRPLQHFRETYPQLSKNTNKKHPFTLYLIEVFIELKEVRITGGFNWLIIGVLKNGDRYCAILDVEVRPMFRSCRLMTLMKHDEIEYARKEKSDFIHTWHASDNPDFNEAIIPSLKAGFVLFHGDIKDGKDYEDRGYVHLRYYFDRKKVRNVRVWFKEGTEFQSPENNYLIIHHLLKSGPYPGRKIARIEEYPKKLKRTGKKGKKC